MRVALFVPCYIDQFYPQVAISTLELLEKLGCTVEFPFNQTCCGQPMANSGFEHLSIRTIQNFIESFSGYEYIVAPSGSCVLHVREHFKIASQTSLVKQVQERTFELCEFLHDVLQVKALDAKFPYRVGLHQSCHGLRGMRLAQCSELNAPEYSKIKPLLSMVEGLELVPLSRPDECCGFGGTFAVSEEAVSVKMGKDRIQDHLAHQAQVITGGDMSCLMHLEGIIKRQNLPLKVLHIAQILNHGW
ncbi:MAG: (Fe-S)-binding protein [Cytophagales bacterium]|nr:(Fe-S)-binding protein [Cytophagales bacterium]MDW8383465.1 (Fe-S)-binding protein [Flammeovirgaceae bacterium]